MKSSRVNHKRKNYQKSDDVPYGFSKGGGFDGVSAQDVSSYGSTLCDLSFSIIQSPERGCIYWNWRLDVIHMLVEQRYPLTRELMQRMLEHKLEVQKETEDALNVIRFVMKQKEDLEREEE
ncbi:hypothetical protein Tco_1264661 [Tanacetum coccineum]